MKIACTQSCKSNTLKEFVALDVPIKVQKFSEETDSILLVNIEGSMDIGKHSMK